MSYDEKVLKYIDSHRDEVIAFMQKLLQTESISGDESKVAAIVAAEHRKDGLNIELLEPAKNRVSVIARHKGTTHKPKVMMYSHYDVVPAGDLSTWTYPPFAGEIHDGVIYGRGACDNKVATTGLVMAYRAIKKIGAELKGDIIFTHVADEEKGGKFGFREILAKGYGDDVDYLFYAHGGSGDIIGIAANGCVQPSIFVKGKGAHTSRLETGINAVGKAAELIKRLEKLGEEVNKRTYHVPGTDTVMRSRLSINKCVGYVANNNVPDSCEVLVDRRYTPGETAEQVQDEFRSIVAELKKDDPEFDAEIVFHYEEGNPVSVSPADSDIVKSLQKSAKKVGVKAKPAGGSHSSDHGWFVEKLHKPVASYGIGGTGGHMADENCKVDDLILTTKVYALFMLDFLGVK